MFQLKIPQISAVLVVSQGDRLLSILAPLRAFGDFKFKWSRAVCEDTLGAILGEHACPPNYRTPPYLTAQPDVTYHRLNPRDKARTTHTRAQP